MRTDDLLANWVGALAVLVSDAQEQVMSTGRRTADVAVLQTLRQPASLSIQDLRAAAGLTHSAAVRAVDRLCAEGFTNRVYGADPDGRRVTVSLTAAGKRQAGRLQHLRQQAVTAIIAPLDEEERAVLRGLVRRLLEADERKRASARYVCRFCDHVSCDGPVCPVGSTVTSTESTRPSSGESGRKAGDRV